MGKESTEVWISCWSTIDLEKVAVHWAAMTTPSIQYNIIMDIMKKGIKRGWLIPMK